MSAGAVDNLTHTLVGVAVGRTFDRREGTAASAAVWTGIVASNLPDIDSFLPPVVTGTKIDFLLHHRGWTHTLVLLPVLAAVSVAAVLAFRAWRAGRTDPRPFKERFRDGAAGWRPLAGVALAALALHIAFDFLNSYGVHPWAPFSRGWSYGDSVFIVEPLLWWALLPFAIRQAATRRRQLLWLGAGLSVPLILLLLAPLAVPAAVVVFAAIAALAQWRRPGPVPAWIGAAAVVLVFAAGGIAARARATEVIAEGAPGERRLDVVTNPAPANPLCWAVQTVGVEDGHYVARDGRVSLAPGIMDPASCYPIGGATKVTAPLEPSTLPVHAGIAWTGEFRVPVEAVREQAEDCRILALLGFVRVPFWTQAGHRFVFGDLRYDWYEGQSFGEVRLDNVLPSKCPVSPWAPPRADLLSTP